jgi:flavin reductase (DIM6/NTAB) family NADH-FMN oxidoreductase RutF
MDPTPGTDAPGQPVLEVRDFWKLIGQRATAVTVVTAAGEGGPAGFLALSATHLSSSPPTMMVSIDAKTSALETIRAAKHFAINILAEGDRDVADSFGGKGDLKGAQRFATRAWSTLTTGAPALDGAVATIDCKLEDIIERPGAVIAIGRIAGYRVGAGLMPLVFFAGGYTTTT